MPLGALRLPPMWLMANNHSFNNIKFSEKLKWKKIGSFFLVPVLMAAPPWQK
jgi:hypothetical protein